MRYRRSIASLLVLAIVVLSVNPGVLIARDHDMQDGDGRIPGDPEGGMYVVPGGSSNGITDPLPGDSKPIEILSPKYPIPLCIDSCFSYVVHWYRIIQQFGLAVLNGEQVPNVRQR
jgi:hypothetical protein